MFTNLSSRQLLKNFTLLLLFALITTPLIHAQQHTINSFVDNMLEDKGVLKEQLSNQTNHNSFNLFSHGQPGQLLINNQWLSHDALAAFIQSLLQDKTHLNIYGCHFAQGEKGRVALAYLETTLGITVAASDDLTGVDGDWDLEVGNYKNGVTIQEYSHNLQQGTLPIQPGMAATTCGSFTNADQLNSDRDGHVFGIYDIRDPGCPGTPGANAPNAPANWANAGGSNAYHHPSWTNANLGEVFGVDLEYDQASSPDIFLSSGGLADISGGVNPEVLPMVGGTGGEVFRIDGTTGAITLMATLPNHTFLHQNNGGALNNAKFVGLGNLSYNAIQKKLYVTNLEDGNIYVVDATTTGVINQSYDPTPGIADDTSLDHTQRARMVYGIEYNKCDGRVYYSRPNGINADIFSVELNTDGTINTNIAPVLNHSFATSIPYAGAPEGALVSDIEFSDDCTQMMTSERELAMFDGTLALLAHNAGVQMHDVSGATWTTGVTYDVGTIQIGAWPHVYGRNAGGGVSFGYSNYGSCDAATACSDAMVATGDALVYDSDASTYVYGLQISDLAGTPNHPTDSYFIDLDGKTGANNFYDKYTNYDVDVFGGSECFVASCSLSMSQTSTCSESGGVYTQTYDLTLNWIGPPATGDLSITLTGDGTLNTSSVSAATLAGGSTTTLAGAFTVPADGEGTTIITATFDDDSACTSTFTLKAPVPCPADVNPCASTAGCIGGKVFEDFNCNGADDADAGVQGVQIQVYDCNNTLVGAGYSDSDGDWQVCGLTDGDTYRIESVLPESVSCWASPSHVGTDNGSSVQFAQPGSCTDFALVNPLTACFNPTAEKLMTTCFTVGDPLTGGINATDPTIINFNFAAATLGDAKTASATAEQTGSVWGLAYTKQTDVLYMAAMLKRHSGLGPDGLGAIYSSSPYSSPPSLFYDLSAHVSVGTIPDNPSRGLSSNLNDASHDVDAFNKVGKVGIGDIDITPDGSTLYVVNLFDKLVYAIDIANPSAAPLALPALPDPSCTNGEARPWGLKYHNGALYASLTCTAENGGTRDDLEANVYKYNGTSWSASILQIPLNFSRGCANWASSNSPTQCNWNPWVDDWVDFGGEYSQPSPILSDIEFDDEGNMILGFIDRTGHQLGHWNYSTDVNSTTTYRTNQGGDILKAHNNSGTYVLENNGTVGGQTASGSNTNGNPWNGTGGPNSLQGPGGGEFFWADYLTLAGNAPAGSNEEGQHSELASGGLAISAADNIVLSGAMDPNGYDEGGVIWLDNTNGSRAYSLTLYAGDNNNNLFGKATGIGDVEAIISCAPLPLEIGNYVWCDSIENGIQDACESGINNILVSLYNRNGVLVGQDTTSNAGQYYFNQNNVDTTGVNVDGNGIASPVTAWSGMSYSTQYFIVFGAGGQFATDQFTVGGEMYGITAMANTGSNDNIDSDVDDSNLSTALLDMPAGLPFINMTTSATGCGDHKYDLGVTCTSPTYSLGNQVFTDTDNSGDLNGGETGIDGVNLQLLNSDGSVYDSDPNTAGDQALTVTTANGGYYRFDDLPAGDYIVEVVASNFTATSILENFVSSSGVNQEADPNNDSDINDNGLDVPVSGAIRSSVVTLGTPEPTGEAEPGTYGAGSTTGVTADDLFSNLTVDFGFYGVCNLSITQNVQSSCNDNSTNSDESDDYFTIDFNATAVNAGTQYEVVLGANADGTGGTVLATSNYGTAVTVGTATTFDADGTSTYAITVRDATTNTCHQDVTTTTVESCSATCVLTITENVQSSCNDNSTNSDESDDYFTIDFNATAVNAGTQYEVVLGANADGTGGTVLATSNYGTAVTVGTATTFDADGTSTYAITVRDATTNTCHQDVTTTTVESCSATCVLTITENVQSSCNDNSTNSDESDDYFTIDFNATAVNAGTQYEVVIDANADGTGGTVLATSNYGTAVTVGTATTFDADGTSTYAITVRDATTNTCHQDVTTTTVESCSATCVLTITENAQLACNNNGTNSNTSDDYFTIDFNATAVNAGTQYEVVLDANTDGTGGTVLATSNYGTAVTVGTATTFDADGTSTYAITVRDATTNTCHQDVTTTSVESCSSCPTPVCLPVQTVINGGTN